MKVSKVFVVVGKPRIKKLKKKEKDAYSTFVWDNITSVRNGNYKIDNINSLVDAKKEEEESNF